MLALSNPTYTLSESSGGYWPRSRTADSSRLMRSRTLPARAVPADPMRAVPGCRWSDAYLMLVSGLLLGYAIMGRGFAYLGFPPVVVGEVVFFAGIATFIRTGCLTAVLGTLPGLLLAITMAWVVLRTIPFLGAYGFDALRDSVVVLYGGFAFIVMALLLEDPRRVNTILRYYSAFLSLYVPAIPFIFVVSRYMSDYLPKMPGTDASFFKLEPSDIAVHLVGAAVFSLVGFRKLTRVEIALLITAIVMVGAVSRGPMLAEIVPIAAAALMLGKWRELRLTFIAGLLIFSVAYTVEPVVFDYVEAASSDERPISAHQVVDNVLSIVGEGGGQTEGTKEWRLDWWNMIIADTVFGPHFWIGRGFGLNIALADGFSNWTISSDHPPLRSPHNVHITLLARAGVPGVALWFGIIASWFGMMMHAMRTARRRGQAEWAGLLIFISCYVGSIVVNASFDPALEAPMQGVWFWSLLGLGIGSVMVFRYQPVPPSAARCE